ncbi:MAG: rRNA maturation RNase YbeY [Bacteroidetes bacterium]|nr:rRNA maturation RNase YbeY [Bacteroidota bacterium]
MISVENAAAAGQRALPGPAVRRIVAYVCAAERVRAAHFSFVAVDDRMMRTINRKFLRHDYVTDILTFPMEEGEPVAEIYINRQQLRRQAAEHGVTVTNEMVRLVVHGVLHTLGYDDTTPGAKRVMDRRQERYVAALDRKR